MDRQTKHKILALLQAKKEKKLWKKAAGALAAVVVFCTAYALILPAITLSAEAPECGIAEHTHTEECYETLTATRLICGQNIHVHTEDCKDEDGSLICGYADFVVHTHDGTCYDGQGNLICPLEEREAHTHTDACYASVLTCGFEESQGHTHTEDCKDENGDLTCGLEESEGHTHTEDCYTRTLTCEKEEILLHTHDEQTCFHQPEEGDPEVCLVCNQVEIREHTHTDSCFETVTETVLTCDLEEHTHTSECTPGETEEPQETTAPAETQPTAPEETAAREALCGLEEHVHADVCYGPGDENGERPLLCGQEEHTHDDTCYSPAMTEEVPEEADLLGAGIMPFAATDTTEALTLYPGQVYTTAVAAEATTEDTAVSVSSTPNNPAKLKLGTGASFTGDTVDIKNALYTFTGNSTDGWTIVNTSTSTYTYLNLSLAGFPGKNSTDTFTLELDSNNGNYGFKIYSKTNERYLYFYRDGNNRFDRTGSYDFTNCLFLIYRQAIEEDREESSPEIPGYVQLTSQDGITNGGQYLIVAEAGGAYYVLYPSTSTSDRYSHVAKVVPSTLTITAKTAGEATVTAGAVTYNVTVTDTISLSPEETKEIQLPAGAAVTGSDNSVATVTLDEGTGLVTVKGVAPGETTATVTVDGTEYTWNISVSYPSSFVVTYGNTTITFYLVNQDGTPLEIKGELPSTQLTDATRYVFGDGDNSLTPKIDDYVYVSAICEKHMVSYMGTWGYDSIPQGSVRIYKDNKTFWTKTGIAVEITLMYIPEGSIFYDLNLPSMGKQNEGYKGSGWFADHVPSISATTQTMKAGDPLFGKPEGYYEEAGVAGIPGLYRWQVTYVNNLGDKTNWQGADGSLPSSGTTMRDDWYAEGRFDGWTYTATDGVTYLLEPGAQFQQEGDGPIFVSAAKKIGVDASGFEVIKSISPINVTLPVGARLVGHWTEISSVVNFFVNYKGTILDTEGDVTGRRQDAFTLSVAVGHVFYGKLKVGTDNTFASAVNTSITDAFRDHFDKDDPSTQIVVEYLRECTMPFDENLGDTPIEGKTYKTSMHTYSPGANSLMVKNNTLSLLKQTQRTIQVATGTGENSPNPTINPDNCDGDHYEVRWYVLKEQADAWHIDGVLVAKTAEIAITKTFFGLSEEKSLSLIEGSSDGQKKFQIDTKLGTGVNAQEYLTITNTPVAGQYSYGGSDTTQNLPNSYHWTLNAITDETYTMTEGNYELEGYDVSSIIVHYFKRLNTGMTEVKFEYGNSTSKLNDSYPVTGGHTTAVSFNNFYTPTGTGAMAIVKRDSASSDTDSSGLLEGAEFTLFTAPPTRDNNGNWTGEVATDKSGKNLAVSTNHNGTAYFSGINEDTYYLAETKAPSGYTASSNYWKVEVKKDDSNKVTVTLYEQDTSGVWQGPGHMLYGAHEDGTYGIQGSYTVKNTASANTVTVTKTFSGLTAAEMSALYQESKTDENGTATGYQIKLQGSVSGGNTGNVDGDGNTNVTLTLDQAQRSQDGFTFTWTVYNLEIIDKNNDPISYTLNEINYLVKDNNGNKAYADVAVTGTLVKGKQGTSATTTELDIDVNNDVDGSAITETSFTFHSDSSDHIYLTNRYTDTYDVRIEKVDGNGSSLEDAVFELYGPYVDSPNSGKWITFTNGEDGTTQRYYFIQTLTEGLHGIHTGTGLRFDTNYVLKEVKAPDGYVLADPILISDTAEDNHDGVWKTQVVNTSKEDATVTVTATKEWANGHTPAAETTVTLNLYRRAGDSGEAVLVDSRTVGASQDSKTETIAESDKYIPEASVTASNWTVVWENLKAYDTADPKNPVEYQWFVTEESLDGYTTTYSDPVPIPANGTDTLLAGQALGQNHKTVTVTNTAGYVLPETGGSGTAGYWEVGAFILLAAALMGLCIEKRSRRGGASHL